MYFQILSLLKKFNTQSILNDSKGFIFSTDLLLSIIIITVIIGISADAIDYSNGFMGDQNSRAILERCTLEAADILIKTPGSPDNWEVLPNCEGISPGLALNYNNSKSVSNTLSWEKINNLTKNYDKLVENKIFPKNIKSNIIIYPLDPRIKPIIINEEPISSKSAEIVVINRTVQCNFLSNYTVIIMDWNKYKLNNSQNVSNTFKYSQSDICPHQELNDSLNHTSPTNTSPSKIWECHHFNTSADYLEKNDYYLLTDPSPIIGESSYWSLDTANNLSSVNNSFKSPNIKLNDEIKNLMENKKNMTLWIHIIGPESTINSFKVYLVAVPKNTDFNYIKAEYFKFQTCNFILKTWLSD
ncbi:MAG: hypothetical protein Q8N97_04725 [Methanobacteriaceae archaeon]|nr:hypothetical protein [Methanobacteriaceae archaeon]